jgi:hypothetical protein
LYAWGISPPTVLYPLAILSYYIRAVGMDIYRFTTKLCGLFISMIIPIGMTAIGWKVYIINASFDIVMVLGVILFWIETRGMTLEEADKMLMDRNNLMFWISKPLSKAREVLVRVC